jgi:hypothetical protein
VKTPFCALRLSGWSSRSPQQRALDAKLLNRQSPNVTGQRGPSNHQNFVPDIWMRGDSLEVQWPLSFNLMNAQATSHISHSPTRTVRITRLRDEHDRFPGILDDGVFQRLYENAFVIHNGDSRDLVAAYALWTIIDQNGRLCTHEYMVDTQERQSRLLVYMHSHQRHPLMKHHER